jgi:hypothetical protein
VWQHIDHELVLANRERCGREASPSATILDSQLVRNPDENEQTG